MQNYNIHLMLQPNSPIIKLQDKNNFRCGFCSRHHAGVCMGGDRKSCRHLPCGLPCRSAGNESMVRAHWEEQSFISSRKSRMQSRADENRMTVRTNTYLGKQRDDRSVPGIRKYDTAPEKGHACQEPGRESGKRLREEFYHGRHFGVVSGMPCHRKKGQDA